MKMDKARNIQIMGIVNLTDDSYFAPSRCLGTDGMPDIGRTVGMVGKILSEGADIIDMVLKAIKDSFPDAVISIDTWWASVVEKAAGLIGPFIVNDISAGEDDPGMLPAVGRLGLQYIAMHKRGTPSTMQSLCNYGNVTSEVLQYFRKFAERAEKAGIKDWILDPGFGFAKDIGQNWQLLRELEGLRKSMIYRLFGITPEESLAQTQVLHFAALERGADILRVHDVAEAARTIEAYRRLI